LNRDLSSRTGGYPPLRYVDVDDTQLQDFPQLAAAAAEGRRPPIVLVGDEVKYPGAISVYWVREQLAELGVPGFAQPREARA
jgi:hypothetical protein